jgi:hypothetical protein
VKLHALSRHLHVPVPDGWTLVHNLSSTGVSGVVTMQGPVGDWGAYRAVHARVELAWDGLQRFSNQSGNEFFHRTAKVIRRGEVQKGSSTVSSWVPWRSNAPHVMTDRVLSALLQGACP